MHDISWVLCIHDSKRLVMSNVLSWVYAYICIHMYINEDNHDHDDYN